jgi:hypothetical protein
VNGLRRHGGALLAALGAVSVLLLVSGWGSAVAAQVTNVLVTNTATNPVPVRQADPADTFSLFGHGGVSDCPPRCLPAGTAWHITSITYTNFGSQVGEAHVEIYDAHAQAGIQVGLRMAVPADDEREMTFEQPFTMTAPAQGWCLEARESSAQSPTDWITIIGYRT